MDIYPAMSASLKNFTSTLSTTTAFDPKQSQRVFSIACNSLVSYSLIPTLMRNIQTTAPHISIEVHPLFTEDYESDLRQQRYDIVIDRVPREHTNLKYKIIGKEQLTLVCSVDHPRVKESVTLEQYMNEQHVVSSTWQSRQAVLSEQDLAELNKREVRCSAAGIAEMLAVVEGSEFICLSTQSMFKRFGAHYNLKSVPSPADEFVFDLAIIWHPSRTNEPGHVWLRKEVEKTNTYKQ
jgi:DNA-binding transcriptional LysR family regulator